MHERFPKCCVWWCFVPPVHPTFICCQYVSPLILLLHTTIINRCGMVRISDWSHITLQYHWLQQSFPNVLGAQFPIFPIVFLTPIWLESHWWSLLLLFYFILFCIILVCWIPWSLYVMWVHQFSWMPWSFLQVYASLWPSTWVIRFVFVVSLWLWILHSQKFSCIILRMLLGSLSYPHPWGFWFLWVPSTYLFGCSFLLLVCWYPTL